MDRLRAALSYTKSKERWDIPHKLYIIRCLEFYKIGIACNAKTRCGALQIGCPIKLELLKTWDFPDPAMMEELLHARYARWWVRGEWFKLSKSEVETLIQMSATELVSSLIA